MNEESCLSGPVKSMAKSIARKALKLAKFNFGRNHVCSNDLTRFLHPLDAIWDERVIASPWGKRQGIHWSIVRLYSLPLCSRRQTEIFRGGYPSWKGRVLYPLMVNQP